MNRAVSGMRVGHAAPKGLLIKGRGGEHIVRECGVQGTPVVRVLCMVSDVCVCVGLYYVPPPSSLAEVFCVSGGLPQGQRVDFSL